jgi:glutathione S-transferase
MLILTVTGITIMSQSSGATPLYELYYNPFSICSLMVLLTLRWKGEPKSPDLAIDPIEKEIDIYTGEQMSKEYLEKNWKGQVRKPPCLQYASGLTRLSYQVPALIGPQPVSETDSLDITKFLCARYPQLLPNAHSDTIHVLLQELHEVWYVSLSFTAAEGRGEGIVRMIQELIAQPTTSEEYKTALKRKLQKYVYLGSSKALAHYLPLGRRH